MSLIFRIASLCWATVSLLGKRAKRGGEKGLRRDAPPAGGCYRSRAGDRGQRSEIMADSVPLRPPKCPRSGRNTVRHAAGMVSAIGSESCPSWAGTRTRHVDGRRQGLYHCPTGLQALQLVLSIRGLKGLDLRFQRLDGRFKSVRQRCVPADLLEVCRPTE